MAIRELIERLTEVANALHEDLDTPLELGICDGENLISIEEVDIDFYAEIPADGSSGGRQFVLIRGHQHPGEGKPKVRRALITDVDEELRRLTDEGNG